jgi:hypothetical protein
MRNDEQVLNKDHVKTQQHLQIALVTETYPPEINGVAMTVGKIVDGVLRRGHFIQLIRPRHHANDQPTITEQFVEVLVAGVPIPRYQGLNFGLPAKSRLVALWKLNRPDIVHVVTEGPLGWSAFEAARHLKIPISSSFHTNFHTYTAYYRLAFLRDLITNYLRKLHNQAQVTMVPTQTLANELQIDD